VAALPVVLVVSLPDNFRVAIVQPPSCHASHASHASHDYRHQYQLAKRDAELGQPLYAGIRFVVTLRPANRIRPEMRIAATPKVMTVRHE